MHTHTHTHGTARHQVLEQLGLEGVLVLEVPAGTPAAAAALRPTYRDVFGDIVLGDIIVGECVCCAAARAGGGACGGGAAGLRGRVGGLAGLGMHGSASRSCAPAQHVRMCVRVCVCVCDCACACMLRAARTHPEAVATWWRLPRRLWDLQASTRAPCAASPTWWPRWMSGGQGTR
jgi:hypothetical protein